MTDTYKVLGQAQSAVNEVMPLYTTPAGKFVATSHVSILNSGAQSATYSLYAFPPNEYELATVGTAAAWVQRGSDIDGEAASDQSGYSVSLSSDGTILAIGAPFNGSSAGHVRVYAWSGSAWVQRGSDIDGEAAGDQSGWSISLSSDGSVLAIGANNNDGAGTNAGHVRVYAWNGTAWVQRGSDIDGEATEDASGWSISLSSNGTILAIGANNNDGAGTNAGHVRVYAWNGTAWVQRGSDIDGEAASDQSGYSVSLSSDGTILAIGAPFNGSSAGHVRVYAWSGSAWVQRGSDIDGEAAFDRSGISVSLSEDGSILAIGADANGIDDAGHVRVYAWNGTAWAQRGSDIDGEADFNYSGRSVSLSEDGSILAIGAIQNSGNGTSAGHVRVYAWSGSAWVQRGSDIDGEAASDQSGYSVSLSSDGSVVAIGANGNDGTASSAGHVRVYIFNPPTSTVIPEPKHAIIKSKEILVGQHHEITGGIVLDAGSVVAFESTSNDIAFGIYGVEIS